MPKLTDEEKRLRKEFREEMKQRDKEEHKDKLTFHKFPNDPEGNYKSFVIFDDTEVTEGGWLQGKWMTAKEMRNAESRWVKHSYKTRADEHLKGKFYTEIQGIPISKLKEIDADYDLSAGVAQCGGCRFFAALDGDYGMCCNESSENDGRVTFEHGGCVQHSVIQRILKEGDTKS